MGEKKKHFESLYLKVKGLPKSLSKTLPPCILMPCLISTINQWSVKVFPSMVAKRFFSLKKFSGGRGVERMQSISKLKCGNGNSTEPAFAISVLVSFSLLPFFFLQSRFGV